MLDISIIILILLGCVVWWADLAVSISGLDLIMGAHISDTFVSILVWSCVDIAHVAMYIIRMESDVVVWATK